MTLQIAQRLQTLRQANGYSQEALAEKLGLSRQAISKWERAESSPDTDHLIELAKLYGVTLDELLFGTDADCATADASQPDSCEIPDEENEEPSELYQQNLRKLRKRRILWHAFPYPIAVTIAFLVWGFAGGWAVSWTLFLTVPLYYSLVEAIVSRNANAFAWPVFVTFVYCFAGMQWGLWHPMWLIFLTVPLYYGVVEMFSK
ncbi:MAG: helix-turn-helix transcriptional regulator [Clostridia bacterium]|nr:helix-turn-helix transcriptional regulator [Clostridia bacterium]